MPSLNKRGVCKSRYSDQREYFGGMVGGRVGDTTEDTRCDDGGNQ